MRYVGEQGGLVGRIHGENLTARPPALSVLGGHQVPGPRPLVVVGAIESGIGVLVVFDAGGPFAGDLEAAKIQIGVDAVEGQSGGCSVLDLYPAHIR